SIHIATLENRNVRTLSVSADMEIDFAQEKMEIFHQAWSILNEQFYDENFHGANWQALRAQYQQLVAGATSPDELRRIISMMIGELNASHLGISGPGGGGFTTGRLGLRFDREEYETNGRLKITEIIPLSPAAVTENIAVGDYLLAVDGVEINKRV